MSSKCRDCGAELIWGQYQTQRVPLDISAPVYRIAFGGGTPTLEKCSPVPGMPHAAMVDHRRVCTKRRPAPKKPAAEEE